MKQQYAKILKDKLDEDSFVKLSALTNEKLHAFVVEAIELCQPQSVIVCDDSLEDIARIRQMTIDNSEETPLAIEGHTVHFDGIGDQARDKKNTRYLVPAEDPLSDNLNQIERQKGLAEVREFLTGIMEGKTMLVRFFCLGPANSDFSISCVQITDSAYVAHSEDLLYRPGYEQFRKLGGSEDFFRFLHSAGQMDERKTSLDIEKRRIYIDYTQEIIYSVNTQYAGNTVGLKKLALRLAIRKADREGWLAEHMFVMGVNGPNDRKTYFVGAFPSACGKTSTAMLPGETIIGDDIAYLRRVNGQARCVNVEAGIFGIIRDVNSTDDPVIYNALNCPGEVIFGNVLVNNRKPYWLGMGCDLPNEGENYSGQWHTGKIDLKGKEISPSHKNARYTVSLRALSNVDPELDNPQGVPIGGIIYGGRDSDTSVPVQQSFEWAHGIITMGASLESETTAATLGAEGVRTFNLMSNLDFLAIPLGRYIQNNLDFVEGLTELPQIFQTNYFLKKDGKYLNGMLDKAIWVKWMERKVHGDVEAIQAPTGWIPKYEDLKDLFQTVLKKDYTQQDYLEQFTIRIPENLAKLNRIEQIYRKDVADTPEIVFEILSAQRKRLEKLQASRGDYVSPMDL